MSESFNKGSRVETHKRVFSLSFSCKLMRFCKIEKETKIRFKKYSTRYKESPKKTIAYMFQYEFIY